MTRTSRRSLLAGTLGSGLMAQVETPPEVRLPRKIRLALAGFDGHPEEILRVLPQLPDVELVAVADEESDPARTGQRSQEPVRREGAAVRTLTQLLAAEQARRGGRLQPQRPAGCGDSGLRGAQTQRDRRKAAGA